MKKYFFAFLFFCIALISIDNVYAISSPYWASSPDIIHPLNAVISDCGNGNCSVDLNATFRAVGNDNGVFYYYNDTTTSMSSGGAGVMWAYQLNSNLKSGYLYSLTTYICQNSNYDIVFKNLYTSSLLSTVQNLSGAPTIYNNNTSSDLNTLAFNGLSFNKCGFTNTIFKANDNSKWIGYNYSINGNNNGYYSFLAGYSIDSLGNANGLTSSDIQNVINSSGLATANDINSIERALDNIEDNIIDSQEQTRDAIIQNQNDNTDREIESQEVCTEISNTPYSGTKTSGYLNSNGTISSESSSYVTDFIPLSENSTITLSTKYSNPYIYNCFYDSNKSLISCKNNYDYPVGNYTFPSNARFVRLSYVGIMHSPILSVKSCQNGNQVINDSINGVNDTLNNSDSSGATDDAGSFFSGFSTNTFGLTSIITSPLNLINSLTSKTCSPLTLQIPFINQTMQLPCMSTIYQQHFGSFLTIYQTITFGVVSYWVCIRIFALVKDFKNPEHDEIEVMDL